MTDNTADELLSILNDTARKTLAPDVRADAVQAVICKLLERGDEIRNPIAYARSVAGRHLLIHYAEKLRQERSGGNVDTAEAVVDNRQVDGITRATAVEEVKRLKRTIREQGKKLDRILKALGA